MAEQTSGVWVVCPQCGHAQIHHVKMERSTNSYIVDCDAGDGHRYVIDVSFEPIISIWGMMPEPEFKGLLEVQL